MCDHPVHQPQVAVSQSGSCSPSLKITLCPGQEDEAKLKADGIANPAATAVSTAPAATNSNKIAPSTSDMQTPNKTTATGTPNIYADAVKKPKAPLSKPSNGQKPAARARFQTGDDGDEEDEQTRMVRVLLMESGMVSVVLPASH